MLDDIVETTNFWAVIVPVNIAFDPVISPVAVILPDIIALPDTSNFAFGDVFPIPNNDVSVNDSPGWPPVV